jgi:phosphotransferase system  glucose/maltose/N-acetylglucosamine-specific IIC component
VKVNLSQRFWHVCGADFFSPKDFIRHAVLMVLAFGVAHLFGLREYTSFLNGTTGSVELGYELSALLGLVYLLLYFAVVLLVPILILAALSVRLWLKYQTRNASSK